MTPSINLRSALNILKQFSGTISPSCLPLKSLSCSKPFDHNFYTSWSSGPFSSYSSVPLSNTEPSPFQGFSQQSFSKKTLLKMCNLTVNPIRTLIKIHYVDQPAPETCKKNLFFKVHYPKDGKYTIQPLPMTKLAGRDPETGRIIFGKVGGGHKRKYRWVIFDRVPPGSEDPRIEKVMHVQYDPNRTARIALVGHKDELRFIIATKDMKQGDIISSTRQLPKMTIRAKEGDAHPIGALPVGTRVCCIERMPRVGPCFKISAGTSAQIVQKLGEKMVVQVTQYLQYALDPNCLVVVGEVSTPTGKPKKPIGSAQRSRWLGIRPSSGLFQKKTGRFGFRRRFKQPVQHQAPPKPELPVIYLSITSEDPSRRIIPATNRVS